MSEDNDTPGIPGAGPATVFEASKIVEQLLGDQNQRAAALTRLYPDKSCLLLTIGQGEGIGALAGRIDPTFFLGLLSLVQQMGDQFGLTLQFVPRPGQQRKIVVPFR